MSMSKRRISLSPNISNIEVSASTESKSASMNLLEDLARREKTPFVMTSIARRGRNVLEREGGRTVSFSPGDAS
jgi:hypothetical protein